MKGTFQCDIYVSWHLYAKFLLGCQQLPRVLLWSVVIWTLCGANLQAATESSASAQLDENWSPSELLEQVTFLRSCTNPWRIEFAAIRKIEGLKPAKAGFVCVAANSIRPVQDLENLDKEEFRYRLEPKSFLIAAPENFNPGLRILPPPPPPPPKPPSTEPVTPIAVLENIYTNFHYDTDNYGLENLFIEPTAQFRLRNGNKITFKTGSDYFEQRGVQSITNIPLQFGWVGKVDRVTLQTAAGVDFFDRLPTAINLNAKVEAPILPPKVSPAGKLLSVLTLSANLEQGPYKSNARTLDHQITAWRFGPDLYWQIDRDTSLFSSLRLGNYNDGNSEVQSFSRLERKLGQFSVAANAFTWSYDRDLERKSGYFSPPDFLVYNAELGWEGDVFKFLRCRLSANLGEQRLKGKFDNANGYQTRCTVKLSPNLEADLGYTFSNVRSHETGGSGYGGNSLAGQLRIKF